MKDEQRVLVLYSDEDTLQVDMEKWYSDCKFYTTLERKPNGLPKKIKFTVPAGIGKEEIQITLIFFYGKSGEFLSSSIGGIITDTMRVSKGNYSDHDINYCLSRVRCHSG